MNGVGFKKAYFIPMKDGEIISFEQALNESKKTSTMNNTIKWQDANVGDSALVKADNKMGTIFSSYGRKFNLKFVNGDEKTYDAKDLEFYSDEKYADGGQVRKFKKGNYYYYKNQDMDDAVKVELTDIQEWSSGEIEQLQFKKPDGSRLTLKKAIETGTTMKNFIWKYI